MSTPGVNFKTVGVAMHDKAVPAEALQYLTSRGHTAKAIRSANLRFLDGEETETHFPASKMGRHDEWGGRGTTVIDPETKACWWPRWSIVLPFERAPGYATARVEYEISSSGATKGPPKFLNPAAPTQLYIPKGITARDLRSPEKPLYFVEGHFKSVVAADRGLLAVGVNGHSGIFEPETHRERIRADLLSFLLSGREVIFLTDADSTSNLEVRKSQLAFLKVATGLRCKPLYIELPESAGAKTGIDDYFAAGGSIGKFNKLPRHAPDSPVVRQLGCALLPRTEIGLADRFVAMNSGTCRCDPRTGEWFAWTQLGYRNDLIEAQRLMRAVIDSLPSERAAEKNPSAQKGRAQFEKEAGRLSARDHALKLASSDKSMETDSSLFDADSNLLGVQNGVLDLTTGKLRQPDRALLVTKRAGCNFDAAAVAPLFSDFMRAVTGGDVDFLRHLQEVVGSALLGRAFRTSVHVFYGPPATGKTTLIEIVLKLLGDYGRASKADLLMRHNRGVDPEKPSPFLRSLRGLRLIVCSELNEGVAFDEALLKDLTGGDTITARGLNESPVTFPNTATILIRGNHMPTIGADPAVRERVKVAPFDHAVDASSRDKQLAEKIITVELPGVLNWALIGMRRYVKRGLEFDLPKEVLQATHQMQVNSDVIGLWVDDCCEVDASQSTAPWRENATEVARSYRDWCAANGHNPCSSTSLWRKLRKRFGFSEDPKVWPLPSNGRKWATGIKLKRDSVSTDAVESFMQQLDVKDQNIAALAAKLREAERQLSGLKPARAGSDQSDRFRAPVIPINAAARGRK